MAALQFKYPGPTVIPATAKHTATVVMLHGLGDTSAGWAPVGQMLSAGLPHVKWIFPTAPSRPITCNGGYVMTGWYDILDIGSINRTEDEAGVNDSTRFIEQLVQKEVDGGIPVGRIVVGGFSQGGAVALMMLRGHLALAGILALSTYLPLREAKIVVTPEAKGVPVFMAHGTQDNVVKFEYGKLSYEKIQALGANVQFKTYPMAHSACDPELADVADFLKKVIP